MDESIDLFGGVSSEEAWSRLLENDKDDLRRTFEDVVGEEPQPGTDRHQLAAQIISESRGDG